MAIRWRMSGERLSTAAIRRPTKPPSCLSPKTSSSNRRSESWRSGLKCWNALQPILRASWPTTSTGFARNSNMDFADLIPIAGILGGVAIMWICYKYQELRVIGRKAQDEAALQRTEKNRLEARLAVLERIATDRGIQTAEQIEALRERE